MDQIDGLRLFLRIVERGSLSAAAKDLRIQQSTASKWLAELESRLGVALLSRTTRRLQLTEPGRRLQARASEVVAAFDGLTAELREQGGEPRGRIRLSVPVVYGRLVVVPALMAFLRRHPLIEVELSLSDRYIGLVEEGFDAAVRVGAPPASSERARKLADGRRLLVAAPAYVAARGRPRTPAELKDHDCILFRNATGGATWSFRSAGRGVTVPVRGRLAADNSDAILAMVRAGLGVALLADWLVGKEVRAGRLEQLLPEHEAPPAPVYAILAPGRYVALPLRLLLDHLAAAVRAPAEP